MKLLDRKCLVALLSVFLFSCEGRSKEEGVGMAPDEAGVVGIGGVFFKSENPAESKKWYQENLGIQTDEYGSMFESRNIDRPEEINYLQWSPFSKDTEYFNPSEKGFMINYRVRGIEELVKALREKGVTVVDEIEEYEYGKFVHILDPEGNKLELWEPVDEVFTKMKAEGDG